MYKKIYWTDLMEKYLIKYAGSTHSSQKLCGK